MKRDLLNLLSLGLVLCLGLCLSGCGKDKKRKRTRSEEGVENTVIPVQAPTMEDYRALDEVMDGAVLEVVSSVAGKLEILTESDELMGEVNGKKPRIRCVVASSQKLYKINFEPSDQTMGTQRLFFAETGQRKVYIQITRGGRGETPLLFKRQNKPF